MYKRLLLALFYTYPLTHRQANTNSPIEDLLGCEPSVKPINIVDVAGLIYQVEPHSHAPKRNACPLVGQALIGTAFLIIYLLSGHERKAVSTIGIV